MASASASAAAAAASSVKKSMQDVLSQLLSNTTDDTFAACVKSGKLEKRHPGGEWREREWIERAWLARASDEEIQAELARRGARGVARS